MLTEKDNALLTQVTAETPMGKLLREYWVPVMRSARVEAGGAPLRATILGERLVVFRSPDGVIGVMDEACPHRGVSMALARNEKCGLRCVYHGWLISPDGVVLDAPSHPESHDVTKLKSGAHPAYEHGQMVWTWLGKGEPPAFRPMAFGRLPQDHVAVAMTHVRCSWINMWESLWDTFHAQFLHSRTNRVIFAKKGRGENYYSDLSFDADDLKYDRVTMQSERTSYGMRYTAEDKVKLNSYEYIFPWFLHHAVGPNETDDQAVQAYVPIDADNCYLIQWMFNPRHPLQPDGYARILFDHIENPDDFAAGLPRDGVWGQDRAAMASGESYHGFPVAGGLTIPFEDIAMGESQGRINRTRENLGSSDLVVLAGRRLFLDAMQAHQRGEPPLGRDDDVRGLRSRFIAKTNRNVQESAT